MSVTREQVEAMSDEERLTQTAKLCGEYGLWTLKKRGYYIRPNGKGVTYAGREAWIMTEAEADRIVEEESKTGIFSHGIPLTKHRAPLRAYLNSLDAMHEAEKILSDSQSHAYHRAVSDLTGESTSGRVLDVLTLHATARQRNTAFLLCILP